MFPSAFANSNVGSVVMAAGIGLLLMLLLFFGYKRWGGAVLIESRSKFAVLMAIVQAGGAICLYNVGEKWHLGGVFFVVSLAPYALLSPILLTVYVFRLQRLKRNR